MKLDGTPVGVVLTETVDVTGLSSPVEIMPRKLAIDPMKG